MKRTIHQTTRAERKIPGGRELALDFRLGDAPAVPATLLLPDAAGPMPGALLIHGYTSRKEHMSESAGRALLRRGVASLAIDLPLHGARAVAGEARASRNPLEVLGLWRTAVRESQLAVRYLEARAEVRRDRIGVIGYSLGSFLAVLVAAGDPAVRALVVAAGGDLPAATPFPALARRVVDPLREVRRLRGRPLLLVHGRDDRTMRPEQAQRLYDAAEEPKELRWWDAGHRLPPAAIEEAADWLAERLSP